MAGVGSGTKHLIIAGMFSKNPKELIAIGTAMAVGNAFLGKILEQWPRLLEGHVPYSIRQERKIRWAMNQMFSVG